MTRALVFSRILLPVLEECLTCLLYLVVFVMQARIWRWKTFVPSIRWCGEPVMLSLALG